MRKGLSERNLRKDGVKRIDLSKAQLKATKVASPAKVASLVSEQKQTDSTKKPKAKLVKETYPQKAFKNSLPTNHKNKVNSRTDSMNSLSTNSIVSPIKPKANFIKNVNPIKEVYPRKPYTNSSEPNRKKGKNPQPSKK